MNKQVKVVRLKCDPPQDSPVGVRAGRVRSCKAETPVPPPTAPQMQDEIREAFAFHLLRCSLRHASDSELSWFYGVNTFFFRCNLE